jgi:hypothetical protein
MRGRKLAVRAEAASGNLRETGRGVTTWTRAATIKNPVQMRSRVRRTLVVLVVVQAGLFLACAARVPLPPPPKCDHSDPAYVEFATAYEKQIQLQKEAASILAPVKDEAGVQAVTPKIQKVYQDYRTNRKIVGQPPCSDPCVLEVMGNSTIAGRPLRRT